MHQFEIKDRLGGVCEWRHQANGLTVLTCPTPVAPVVGFGVVYGVGSRHESVGHTGATHILEHLMFKGSQRFNRDAGTEIARLLHRVGAAFNATTWLDRTNYYEVLPVEHVPLAVDIEADRMRHALVREEDLDSERSVVLNELDSGENDPFDLLMKSSFAMAYLEHPYRHPTIGWRGDVEQISAAVLRKFYDTYYHPDNATVIVVGEFTEATLLDAVERGFGELPPAPGPFPENGVRESKQPGERRFAIHRAGEVGCLAMSWHIPEGLHPDMAPLTVLTQILGDGVTARLHRRLVETNRCLGVHAFAMELHDPGLFQIFATLAPGVEHQEIEDAIRAEIASVRTTPPSTEEVARARAQVRTDAAFHHESPAQIMTGMTEAVAMGDWRRFVRELQLLTEVEADDVVCVAANYLDERNLTVGWFITEGGGATRVAHSAPGPRPCYLYRPFADRVYATTLHGGGKMAVLANPHAPTVTIAGTLKAGPALAPDGRFSVPGITAAMLDRGTAEHSRMDLARDLEDHGLQLVVQASAATPTTVSFSAQGLTDELPRLAALLFEVLRSPTFPTEELEKVREQVLGGLARERHETFARALAALTRCLYPSGHPLRRRAIETREQEVRSLVRDDLLSFHGQVYSPATIAVAVVGDVDAEQTVEIFTEFLEGWAGGPVAVVPEPGDWPASPPEERIHIPDRPNLDVFLGHRASLVRGAADYPAAVVANSCLGQSTLTSRLGLEVRDREGLTYGIYSRFFGSLHLPGPWATFFSVGRLNLERAHTLARRVVAEYVEEGPADAELADEKTALAGAYRVGLATNSGVARELVTALTAGEEVARLDEYPERLLAVDREEVLTAIRKHFHPEQLVMTVAGDLMGDAGS